VGVVYLFISLFIFQIKHSMPQTHSDPYPRAPCSALLPLPDSPLGPGCDRFVRLGCERFVRLGCNRFVRPATCFHLIMNLKLY